jgi:hypothetical protein
MLNDYQSNLSKDDKAFIIKMSAVAFLTALVGEALRLGFEEVRELIKKKRKPLDKPEDKPADLANKIPSEEKK